MDSRIYYPRAATKTHHEPKASLEEIQITSIHHFLPAFRPKEMVKGMLVTWISSFLLPLPKTKIV